MQLDCGDFIENDAADTPITDCNMACTGDASQSCGGPSRLNLFFSGGTPPPPPVEIPGEGEWESLGCYTCVIKSLERIYGEDTDPFIFQ